MENYESKQRLTSYISFVRDCELEKPINEINEEIVGACVKLLLKLQGKEVAFTTEQIKEKVRKIPVVLHADTSNKTNPNVRKHINKKKILLIAAIIAILCAILAIFSIGYNLDYWHDIMNDKFGSVHTVPIGEFFENENEEFVNTGIGVFYEDINEFRKNEKINILLPLELPDNTSITRIQISESKNKIYVSFNNVITSYEIHLNTHLQKELSINSESYTTDNGIICYIEKIDQANIIQIYFENNGNTYIIGGTDEQNLLDIINNLEVQ